MSWTEFADAMPDAGRWIEVASYEVAEDRPLLVRTNLDPVSRFLRVTHWRYYQPPTDLPPKPLPKLEYSGARWEREGEREGIYEGNELLYFLCMRSARIISLVAEKTIDGAAPQAAKITLWGAATPLWAARALLERWDRR